MGETKTYGGGIGSWILISLVLSVLAWVITHDIYAGASIFVLGMVLDFTSFVSLIPGLGLVLQYIAMNWLWDKLMPLLTIPADVMWIANLCWWIAFLYGVLVTVIVVIMVFVVIKE
jgi:hypothetical protein